jgi:hypothetical protein
MILDTFEESTAVDLIVLPLWHRNIEIDWRSGSTSTVPVRRRDQVRLLWYRLTDLDISYGRFANWAMGDLNPAL